ncbi:MAG: PLP-dependent aminotransferase family protein, partial [Aeromonas sp.]
MSRQVNMVELAALGVLERDGRRIVPALCQRLRVLIRSGQLQAGDQLPSSRLLAMQLGISRSSVTSAYEQLIAEGYLDAEHGAGTRVCRALPNVQKPSGMAITAPTPALPPRSASLAAVASAFNPLPAIPFAMAVPCGKVAPDRHWLRLRQRVLASQPAQLGSYGDPQGLPALREALCDYLRTSRAVHCEPDQIILTEGTQQGLYVAAMTLLEPGHTALVEDPAYGGLTALLTSLGITMAHVPVDEQGIDIAR